MKILTDYFTTHCTVKTRQRFGNAHTTKARSSALSNGIDQRAVYERHFFLRLFPEVQQTKHHSSPHFLTSACIQDNAFVSFTAHMLLTQLPLLRNKHRASIFKNTVKLCYNIPSPVSSQYSLFQAPPPAQDFLSSALKALDASGSQFSSLRTSPRSGIFLLRSSCVCVRVACG